MEMERVSRLLEHKNRLTIQNNQPTDQPNKQTEWLPNQSNITNQPTDQPTKQEDRFINQTTNQLDNKEANQTTQPDWSTNCPVIQTRRQIKQPASQPEQSQLTQRTIRVLKWSIKRELGDLKFLLKVITLLTKWDPVCFNSAVSFGPTLPKRLSWERWRKTERKVGK